MIITRLEDGFLIKVFKSDKLDVFDIDCIRKTFKDIIKKIKLKYNLYGMIDADIYINEYYGLIIEIKIIDYDVEETEVNIMMHFNDNFLVEIESNNILDYRDVYYYKGKFYGTYQDISDNEVLYKDIDDIINDGIKVC